MPAKRSAKRKARSSNSSQVEPCRVCGTVISRASDFQRHMDTHKDDAMKLPCRWEGCNFSTLQKSNLETHYRRHTGDKSLLCTDDPNCGFKTCDPSSLHRHRINQHNYIPRLPGGRKKRGRRVCVGSPSVASPVSLESSPRTSFPASISPSLSINSYSPASEEAFTSSMPETHSSVFNEFIPSMNSFNSPLHRKESLLLPDSISPCSSNYTWDASPLPELGLDLLATDPELEKFKFQYPDSYQGHQEEPKAQPKHLFDLPDLEQVLPGYGATEQLQGSYGLDFGLEKHVDVPEVTNEARFNFSANGSPFLYRHNLPVECFQVPIDCSPTIYSPVRTGGLELDMETISSSGLDIPGIPMNTELAQMACDFNPLSLDPSSKLGESAVFADATNPQFHQVTLAPIPNDLNVNLQTHANPDLIPSSPRYFDRCQLTEVNGEVNLYLHPTDANPNLIDLSASGVDYFDQCRWDFGFHSASGIVEGPPG